MKIAAHVPVLAAAVLAGTGLLAGCATTEDRWARDDVPVGSRLTIEQPLPVSSYSGWAYVQAGRAIGTDDIDRFSPHCRFGSDGASADEAGRRTIQPGEFEVVSRRTRTRVVASPDDRQVRLASGGLSAALLPDPASMASIRYETRLGLHSAEQPRVDHMTCAYDINRRSPHLGFTDIRDTLAGVATLRRPEED